MLRVLLLWGMVVTGIVAMATALKAEVSKKSGPMSEEKALEILNDSPWARQQTSTRLIQGVGSGEYGEKEIFSRYYVRILSAAPVRRAFERVRDLAQESGATPAGGGNATVRRARSTFDAAHIVIAVAFRSNEPEMQRDVDRTMRSQTLDTIRNRAYISTAGSHSWAGLARHLSGDARTPESDAVVRYSGRPGILRLGVSDHKWTGQGRAQPGIQPLGGAGESVSSTDHDPGLSRLDL
ncbi:MAG: hypothetical protein P8Y94_07820 [Acidobacteriota bacterium]